MTQLLLVEPDASLRADLENALLQNGYLVESAARMPLHFEGAPAGVQALVCDDEALDSSILDLTDLAQRAPVILLSHINDLRRAVAMMQQGAADYLVHPLQQDELVAALERALESSQRDLSSPSADYSDFPMLGRSPVMLDLFRNIRSVGATNDPVLISGEPGTGKELVAHALHAASSRKRAPMICVNCASIPERLLETELFGQEPKRIVPGQTMRNGLLQAANGGSLFLDEIGALPLEAQARLLQVLQHGAYRGIGTTATHAVDVRVLAASQRKLLGNSQTGRFHKDLLYHLSTCRLDLPPLRERGEDIHLLAEHLLGRICNRLNRPPCGFAEDALQAMSEYHWPGNVRELENAIERAVILNDQKQIRASLLALQPRQEASLPGGSNNADTPQPPSLEDYFVQFVRDHQEELTETELALRLGISRKSLWERRQRLDIPRKKTRKKAPRRNQNHNT